jgi:mono/diheme cytochrome c family protein
MEGKYYERVAIAVIFAVILYAVVRQCWTAPERPAAASAAKRGGGELPTELRRGDPDDPETVYRYILHVINHGSNRLGFPGGVMEGGYVSEEDAPKIACYVTEMGGHSCPRPVPKDAAMFYTSVCGGCHGNDGKGLHGAYPDLTRPRLLGIEKMLKKNGAVR